MFHKAAKLEFGEGTVLEVTFRNGKVKRYDMASLFGKYPQLRALEDRELFLSGRLLGHYGIVWNDALDLETETVYQEGKTVRAEQPAPYALIGDAVYAARARRGLSQKELSALTGIEQADISRIEHGRSNVSVDTLQRIASALQTDLLITLQDKPS